MNDILERIKNQVVSEHVRVSQHAQQEMEEEAIFLDDTIEAILSGKIIEKYPEHKRGACCLINGISSRA